MLGPGLRLPAVHDPADLRLAGEARPDAARGRRGARRPAGGAVPAGHPAALACPASSPGRFLVFIPALGSFLTSDLLGGAKQLMIGNLIQNQFAAARNWPFGSAASFVLMALVLVAVMAVSPPARPRGGRGRRERAHPGPRWLVGVGGGWSTCFLHLPILILVAFSFNASKFSAEWTRVHARLVPPPARAGRHAPRPRDQPGRRRPRRR